MASGMRRRYSRARNGPRGPWPARPVRGGIHATIEIVKRHPDGDHHGRGVRGIGRDRGSPLFLGRARERPFPGSGWRADPDADRLQPRRLHSHRYRLLRLQRGGETRRGNRSRNLVSVRCVLTRAAAYLIAGFGKSHGRRAAAGRIACICARAS